jgi:large subunit ribosomal protein L32
VGVPKKRRSKMRQNTRRPYIIEGEMPNMINCPHCGAPTLAHRACSKCGTYRGRVVLTTKAEKVED